MVCILLSDGIRRSNREVHHMTTTKCTKTYGEVLDSGAVEYGFADRLNRSVGYAWRIRQVTYAELAGDGGNYGYYHREPAVLFELWGHPTRNGKKYGPSFNTIEFATLEGARRDVVRRVGQARKRDTKKFAKVPA
jgi:hypothetical protein